MPNYAQLAAKCERLIENSGRSVTFVQLGTDADNAAEPWWGKATSRISGLTVSLPAVFISPTSLEDFGFEKALEPDQHDVKNEQKVLLVSAKKAGANLLENFHEVIDGAVRYGINRAQCLHPGSTRLLYAVEVSR